MRQAEPTRANGTPLARLIDQTGRTAPGGSRLWERLDMEQAARRLIEVARLAAGEHAMMRAREALRQRDSRKDSA